MVNFYYYGGISVYLNENTIFSGLGSPMFDVSGNELILPYDAGKNTLEIVWTGVLIGTVSLTNLFPEHPSWINNTYNLPIVSSGYSNDFLYANSSKTFNFNYALADSLGAIVKQQNIPTESGKMLEISCYSMASYGEGTITISVSTDDSSYSETFDIIDSEWSKHSIVFLSSTSATVSFIINSTSVSNISLSGLMLIDSDYTDADITYINGNKIITGSITADKISVDSITADIISANAITAEKIMDEQIFKRLKTFENLPDGFDALDEDMNPIRVDSDFAHYVIQFVGYNTPNTYYKSISNPTIIVPANAGISTASINTPGLCLVPEKDYYLDEYPAVSFTVNLSGYLAGSYGKSSSADTKSGSISPSTEKTNISFILNAELLPHTRIKEFGFRIYTYGAIYTYGSTNTRSTSVTTTTTEYYYKRTTSVGAGGGTKVYNPGLFAAYKCKIQPYVIDEYNDTYWYGDEYTVYSSSGSKICEISQTVGQLVGTTYYTKLTSFKATLTIYDVKLHKIDENNSVTDDSVVLPEDSTYLTNLTPSITNDVLRSISTSSGSISISQPYSISSGSATVLSDNNILCPKYIYGIR
jgi:hypothetical protein